ncbi:MAG: flagellar motor protein MotB [Acidimicrobiales bacterium]
MSARRSRKAAPDDGQRWLATYGDMVTLLMAFFVMLFAISSVEQEKFDAFVSGLDIFDNPASLSILDPSGEPIAPPIPIASEASPAAATTTTTAPALDPGLEELGRRLLEAVAAAGHPGTIEIQQDERGLSVAIGTDNVLFDVGASQVTVQGIAILDAITPPLSSVDNDILVEGHADTTPLNRGGYTNWNLSTDRAVAVVNVLAGRHAVPPVRLTASGYGEFKPRDPGSDPAALSRNRRVELIIRNAPVVVAAPAATPAPPTSPFIDIAPDLPAAVQETP